MSDPTAFTHAASPAVAGSDTDLPRAAGASVAGRLTPPAELRTELPITAAVADLVARTRTDVMRIVFGSDPRLLVVMGPCSIHDAESAVAYARWLRPLQEHVADALLLVMRVYVEKPRTRTGWKGLVNDPFLDGSFRIDEGLRIARQVLLEVNELGVPAATEFVDVATPAWLGDLISWSALGARSIESQPHRQMTSGLACPVGFKNGTGGSLEVAMNAMMAAGMPQRCIGLDESGQAAAIATTGNEHTHLVLRGGGTPNHDSASVLSATRRLAERGLNQRVMVDCGHGNSSHDERGQIAVAEDVIAQVAGGSDSLLGIMLESNLLAGRQVFSAGTQPVPGLSITDACIGLSDTERMIEKLAAARRPVHAATGDTAFVRHA